MNAKHMAHRLKWIHLGYVAKMTVTICYCFAVFTG